MTPQIFRIGDKYRLGPMPVDLSREDIRNLGSVCNRTADYDDEVDATRAQQERDA